MTAFRGGKPWEENKKKKLQLFSHGEKAGMMLCLAMMLFALVHGDMPLFFFSSSFIVYEVQSALNKIDSQRFHAHCSFLWGLCLALFIGSLFMAFL